MRMERPRTQTTWANDGKARKPFDERRLGSSSVSRRKAAGGRKNRRHRFVGSFGSDRAK